MYLVGWGHTGNLVWGERAQNWLCVWGLASWIYFVPIQVEHLQGHKSCLDFGLLLWPWSMSRASKVITTRSVCDSGSSRDHGSWLCLQWAHLGFPPTENLADRTDHDQYKLLCPDNSQMPVDKYRECNLGLFPSHAVVARNVGGKEDLIWELLNQAQVFPPSTLTSCFVYMAGVGVGLCLDLGHFLIFSSSHSESSFGYRAGTMSYIICFTEKSLSLYC